MILLTGATGNVGSQVLRRLTAKGERVRVLVRDQRRLGSERVRVQIVLGDLSDPASFRNALRGVHTVVHLAAAIRDQPRASLEELNGVATLRLVRAAGPAGPQRLVVFSAVGGGPPPGVSFFSGRWAGASTRGRASSGRRHWPSVQSRRPTSPRRSSRRRSSTR